MSKICTNPDCRYYNMQMVTVNFCTGCGNVLVESPKCRHCEAEVHPNDSFCPMCGRPIK